MKSIVNWAVANRPAMNILMVAVVFVGYFFTNKLNRELFPEFDMEQVTVTVSYPGAAPDEVEEGICQKIEEAVRSVTGVEEVTSSATEGSATVNIELESGIDDVERAVSEIRAEVDRIDTFPELAMDPEVRRAARQETAIRVGVIAAKSDVNVDPMEIRQLSESIRGELLLLPGVSDVKITGGKEFQLNVEIPEATLREYGLTLSDVTQRIQRESMDLPAGTIRGDSQEVMVRGYNRRDTAEGVAALPLITQPGGAVLTVGDLARIEDGFDDTTAICEIDGQTAIALSVVRNRTEDLLALVDEVKTYIAEKELPPGYRLITWGDQSVDVRGRVQLLISNGLQGLLLVGLLLSLFLDLRTAVWVGLGIPFAVFATGAYLYFSGQTLNLLSMFAFIMALGILVDDAIVVSENIHAHRMQGKSAKQAAIDGTFEVLPSVVTAVITTIVAFVPLMFVTGMMGNLLKVLPAAIICMLVASLVESFTVLPCHLSHDQSTLMNLLGRVFYIFRPIGWVIERANVHFSRGIDSFINTLFQPSLAFALKYRWGFMAVMLALTLITGGMVATSRVPFVLLGKLDSSSLAANLTFPNGTPGTVTDRWTKHIEDAFWRIEPELRSGMTIDTKTAGFSSTDATLESAQQQPLAIRTCRMVGTQSASRPGDGDSSGISHQGSVEIELVSSSQRNVSSTEVINAWRNEVGKIPGAESVSFDTMMSGPGGVPVEFKLLAGSEYAEEHEAAVEWCKEALQDFQGVYDISDDQSPGKWEYRVRIKDNAVAMGVTAGDLAETIRSAYYGDEVMRIQRGRNEVKIMVRYPEADRHSMADFSAIRVRTGNGLEYPLTELANIEVVRGYSAIQRLDQMRAVTVSADIDTTIANAVEIVARFKEEFQPTLNERFPHVQVRWEGQQKQQEESLSSLFAGFAVAGLAILLLLTMEFKSYAQPFLIMLIIPFGAIGAIWGHYIMGRPMELFSVLGMVALSGIIINDSIVLIDFINHQRAAGVPLQEALVTASARRFRPILLTSATTIGGLFPLLFETSRQAQMLIPMAVSMSFGLAVGTVLTLYLLPICYSFYASPVGLSEGPAEETPDVTMTAAT